MPCFSPPQTAPAAERDAEPTSPPQPQAPTLPAAVWGAPRTSTAVPKSDTGHPVWPQRVLLRSIPALDLGDLGIWGPVRGQGPGSAERPRCFRVPCAGGTLPLRCSPNVLLLVHTSSCSPGEGTARGGHSGKGSRGETRALRWVSAPLRSRVRTQLDARHPHHFGGLQLPQHGPHPTNTSGTESGPPDSQSRGGQETQSSAALVVRRGISPPLMSSAASRNAPQVKRAQGKSLRAPLPLSQTRNRLLS